MDLIERLLLVLLIALGGIALISSVTGDGEDRVQLETGTGENAE